MIVILDNVMRAIEEGLISTTTKTRLAELENRRDELCEKIAKEKSEQEIQIPKTEIIKYIRTAIRKCPAGMIRLLIKEVVVYNDKIEIYYNYTNKPDDNDRRAFCFYEDTIDLTYNSARIAEYGEMEHFVASRHFAVQMWV